MKTLQHPCILRLNGAYTYGDTYNLIVPYACGGELASLLENDRPSQLQTDDAFLNGLAEIALALEQVHAIDKKNLHLIGCHHDLRPDNILIDGSSFLLADFGLSKFKRASQPSRTPVKCKWGNYTAPECDVTGTQDSADDSYVHRSSDTWSFGCIIAEVLTYMIYGKEGVAIFLERKSFKILGRKFVHFTVVRIHQIWK